MSGRSGEGSEAAVACQRKAVPHRPTARHALPERQPGVAVQPARQVGCDDRLPRGVDRILSPMSPESGEKAWEGCDEMGKGLQGPKSPTTPKRARGAGGRYVCS